MVAAEQPSTAPGRRDAIVALVCVAAVVPTYLVGWAVGTALGSLLDVSEGDLLTTAGPVGWVAAIGLILLLVAPQAVGLRFGLRARRAGAGGIATAGVAANAIIGAYVLVTGIAGLALS